MPIIGHTAPIMLERGLAQRLLEICPRCLLPISECDAVLVARGVALRYLREYAGYSEHEALDALERSLPFAFYHHPPADGERPLPS